MLQKFDASTQQDFFREASEAQKPMTELVSGATPTPGAAGQPEQLVRSGAILLAKREDPDRIWALVVAGAPTRCGRCPLSLGRR